MDRIIIEMNAREGAIKEHPNKHYTWDPRAIRNDSDGQPFRQAGQPLGGNSSLLGAGGYGLVYKVKKQRGQNAGKDFAMKVIGDAQHLANPVNTVVLMLPLAFSC